MRYLIVSLLIAATATTAEAQLFARMRNSRAAAQRAVPAERSLATTYQPPVKVVLQAGPPPQAPPCWSPPPQAPPVWTQSAPVVTYQPQTFAAPLMRSATNC